MERKSLHTACPVLKGIKVRRAPPLAAGCHSAAQLHSCTAAHSAALAAPVPTHPTPALAQWSAAKWIHVGHYAMGGEREVPIQQTVQPVPKHGAPDGCEDMDDLCPEWTAAGE
jgi:hypothetical protein